MKNPRLDGLYFLVLGSALFVLLGAVVTSVSPWTMEDFRTQYYPARCLLQHGDPYNESDVARVYFAEHGNPPGGKSISRFLTTRYIYCLRRSRSRFRSRFFPSRQRVCFG